MGAPYRVGMLATAASGTVRITARRGDPVRRSRTARPPKFASGSVTAADNVLVRVHTDAGLVGQAEAQPRPYTYGETQASIVEAVGGPLSEALTGVDPLRIELVAERCATASPATTSRAAPSTSPSGT